MSHWQGLTGVYADGDIYGISPTNRSDVFDRSAAIFDVVPVATIMETIFNMGLRDISGCRSWRPYLIWGSAPNIESRTRSSRLCNCT
eukprot:5355483-Pleurochrysis_carterae.AAC.1